MTIKEWLVAPDGREYRAFYGTLTDSNVTNKGIQYLTIGTLEIPANNVLCAIQTDDCNFDEAESWSYMGGETDIYKRPSKIYNADKVYIPKLRLCDE